MYSPEVHFLVRQEIYKDLQRTAAHGQLIQIAKQQRTDEKEAHPRIIARIGARMVKLGSKLQHYGQYQQQALTERGS